MSIKHAMYLKTKVLSLNEWPSYSGENACVCVSVATNGLESLAAWESVFTYA